VGLQGNIRVDCPDGGKIHRGVGGKRNYIKGGCCSESGAVIIATTPTGSEGICNIFYGLPPGKITPATFAHQVTVIMESRALAPRDLDFVEQAGGKAHPAARERRKELLWAIRKQPSFQRPEAALR
jgi:hypothetical protein